MNIYYFPQPFLLEFVSSYSSKILAYNSQVLEYEKWFVWMFLAILIVWGAFFTSKSNGMPDFVILADIIYILVG